MEWRAMVIDVNSNNSHYSSGTGVSTLNTSTDPTKSTFFTTGHFTDDEERHTLVGYPRIDLKREAEGLLRCIPPVLHPSGLVKQYIHVIQTGGWLREG